MKVTLGGDFFLDSSCLGSAFTSSCYKTQHALQTLVTNSINHLKMSHYKTKNRVTLVDFCHDTLCDFVVKSSQLLEKICSISKLFVKRTLLQSTCSQP